MHELLRVDSLYLPLWILIFFEYLSNFNVYRYKMPLVDFAVKHVKLLRLKSFVTRKLLTSANQHGDFNIFSS